MKAFLLFIVAVVVVIAGFTLYDSQASNTSVVPPTASTTTSADLPVIIPGVPSVLYEDPQYGFSIYYPSTALLKADSFSGYLPLTQTPVIALTLNPDMFQGTNLSEAGVYIGATTSPSVVSACMSPSSQQETAATSSMTINGTVFGVFDSTGAAAGNIYQEKIFRTVENGACLEIVELLHSGDIGNYPPGKVVAFDQAQFSGILDAMVGTFIFKSSQ